ALFLRGRQRHADEVARLDVTGHQEIDPATRDIPHARDERIAGNRSGELASRLQIAGHAIPQPPIFRALLLALAQPQKAAAGSQCPSQHFLFLHQRVRSTSKPRSSPGICQLTPQPDRIWKHRPATCKVLETRPSALLGSEGKASSPRKYRATNTLHVIDRGGRRRRRRTWLAICWGCRLRRQTSNYILSFGWLVGYDATERLDRRQ